jgi:hypothetical protein
MKPIAFLAITVALVLAGVLAVTRLNSSHSEAAALLQAANITYETDVNRAGSDYRGFAVQADPNICRTYCWNDPTCKAFTYVKPGIQGIQGKYAQCYLKSAVPSASRNGCCVSGYKTGGDSSGGLEIDVNRLGGDYQYFELRSNNPNDCRQYCVNDARCASFTYLRPSYWGKYSHCFLKANVPAATQNGCCISGVVRAGGGRGGRDATAINWDDKGAQKNRGKNGERFTYSCPAGGNASNDLWGTDIYTDDSSICTAAVHAGLIRLSSGGTVTIEIRQGQQSYQGSNRNGISSKNYSGWPGSFVFVR